MTRLTPEANYALYADPSGLSLEAQFQAVLKRNLEAGATPNILTDSLASLAATAVSEARAQSPEGSVLANLEPNFADTVRQSRTNLNTLLTTTGTALTVPELASPELIGIDWKKLQIGYNVMEAAGLQPDVVIAPAGQPLSFWKDLYSNLRRWQDAHDPAAPNLLQFFDGEGRIDNCDGLLIGPHLKDHWTELLPPTPGWTVSVIPAANAPAVLGVNYHGIAEEFEGRAEDIMPPELATLLMTLPNTDPAGEFHNPSVESYLTMQAIRLLNAAPMIDDIFGRMSWQYYTSWLDGNFIAYSEKVFAPQGEWRKGDGYIYLSEESLPAISTPLGRSTLGVRPEVKG